MISSLFILLVLVFVALCRFASLVSVSNFLRAMVALRCCVLDAPCQGFPLTEYLLGNDGPFLEYLLALLALSSAVLPEVARDVFLPPLVFFVLHPMGFG